MPTVCTLTVVWKHKTLDIFLSFKIKSMPVSVSLYKPLWLLFTIDKMVNTCNHKKFNRVEKPHITQCVVCYLI